LTIASSLAAALVMLAPALSQAVCGYLDWVDPATDSIIPRNPLIVLGRYNDLEIAAYRPYLSSRGDAVALVEHERFGADGPGSVTFRPERLLRPHTRYALRFRRPSKDLRFPDAEWITSDSVDDSEPVWSGEPAIDLEQSRAEGDGVLGYRVVFKTPIEVAEGATWAIVEVESETGEPLVSGGAQRRLWHLASDFQKTGIRFEHSECSDGFGLRAEKPYRLHLTLLDMSGNSSATKVVRFRVPAVPYRCGEVHTWVPVESVLYKVEPDFIRVFRQNRRTGTVEGHLTVDETGAVVDVQVDEIHPYIEKSTAEALKQWRFPRRASPVTLPFKTFFFFAPPVFVPDWSAD